MEKNLVEFWFDPVCPWTWITSRWMSEVNESENLDVVWQPFSLKVLNVDLGGKNLHASHEKGQTLGKLFAAVKKHYGNDKVAALYTQIGQRLHPGDDAELNDLIAESLEKAGLPQEILADSNTEEYETLLKESTVRGVELVGPGVGIPIIAINEKAFFGPVVSPAPKGQAAKDLWTAVSIAINTPGFSELKRGREGGLNFD